MTLDSLEKFIGFQGWSMFGITPFEKIRKNLKKHEKFFEEWIKKDYQADMDWLELMKKDRFHPERVLPGIKSVIVLGAVYSDSGAMVKRWRSDGGQPQPLHISSETREAQQMRHHRGVVARYARGKDYHKVLRKKLIELSDFLKSRYPQAQTYASVDSGPTADRALAEAAGLGFFGKNTCLINPPRGSYFFIASLMTDLELPETPEKPMPACGNCRKCIQNCPTGALAESGKLDARKCISYLTIENKGPIPVELRPKIGNRLFGCDACQACCPFNAVLPSEVLIGPLKPENGAGDSLDLKGILSIESDEEFAEKFAGTPLMRAKRRGLLRNACVAAGNSGNKELVSYLEALIRQESDEMLREHAGWAIDILNLNL
ncbi:tRNA epoxyqueuosine(34) reductase QueG [Candidatus Peregrinibacteria bacterium]|nr:tRNA epoxyqueuosine(34) reductase QueG [Candidatus Peregrinibacteria bacterium]